MKNDKIILKLDKESNLINFCVDDDSDLGKIYI